MSVLKTEPEIFRTENILVFFGGRGHDRDSVHRDHPDLILRSVRQTHSDICIESTDTLAEADAHFTSQMNTALLIATADCLPVMIHCRQTGRVAAVHAGWRGVENRITEKTLRRLVETGSSEKNFRFWVGPHIQKESFEVSEDVFRLLAAAHPSVKPENYAVSRHLKYFLDLNVLLRTQVEDVIEKKADIVFSEKDTKTDAGYFSYRRDQTPNRNLSFIAKIN